MLLSWQENFNTTLKLAEQYQVEAEYSLNVDHN